MKKFHHKSPAKPASLVKGGLSGPCASSGYTEAEASLCASAFGASKHPTARRRRTLKPHYTGQAVFLLTYPE
jgi:hypothetical protein